MHSRALVEFLIKNRQRNCARQVQTEQLQP